MTGNARNRRRSQRGLMLVEVLAAAALVMILAVVGAQMLHASVGQRADLRHRQAAIEEAANVLERIAARPWSELTPANLQRERLSDAARQANPSAKLAVELVSEAGPPAARQVIVTITWHEAPVDEPLAVHLTAWRFAEPKP